MAWVEGSHPGGKARRRPGVLDGMKAFPTIATGLAALATTAAVAVAASTPTVKAVNNAKIGKKVVVEAKKGMTLYYLTGDTKGHKCASATCKGFWPPLTVKSLHTKVVKGKGFDMADLKSQLEQLQKMGGVGALLDKLPGAVTKKGAVSADQGDRELRRQIAIINSMTPRERRNPGIIDGSRRRRIAGGSGVQVQDVNRLLKQFQEMQRVMKSMKGGKLRQLMSALKGGMGGGPPPGFPGR